MRAVFAAVTIIVFAIVLMQMGVCQGETACVRECQAAHCKGVGTEKPDCSSPAFRECAVACREAAK